MKIFAIQQKRTPQGRRKSQQNDLTTKENRVKRSQLSNRSKRSSHTGISKIIFFPPVVKVNSHASPQSETVLGAISSNSDASYTPTPIPAPVYNPTPLNLKDNNLQQLKDAKKKRRIILNLGRRKFGLKSFCIPHGLVTFC